MPMVREPPGATVLEGTAAAPAADSRRFDGQVHGVREAARARLADSGWEPGSNDTIRRPSCPCPDFQAGGAQGACRRISCGHSLVDHDVPV
ncbi:hypothetical protein [Streptomyces sp. NK15101]|uniref:hypothetical protein n=1 Tax=Streptomyces sp. NK15101 TaxID=2873261 RepID=UPI001CED354E|nr:hypothetical protein [Streptomyces sp. NK15101]